MQWTKNLQRTLGISNNELKVLKVLTQAQTIQEVTNATPLSRTATVYILKNLMSKGLVKTIKFGKRHKYLALTSHEITNRFQELIDEIDIESKNKKGVRIKTTPEDEFIIHVGTKEIIPAYSRIASENKNQRIRAIQHHRSYKAIVEKASAKLLAEFNSAVVKNKLIIDGMLNESAYKTLADEVEASPSKYKDSAVSLEGRMADYTIFPDNLFNHDAEIWIFKTTTLIINWYEEVAIEITNTNMTNFLKDMFELVKRSGKKIDHNQAIRNVLKLIPALISK